MFLTEGSCSRLLQQRCPACFGGTHFGRAFDRFVRQSLANHLQLTLHSDGGDVHVAIDATFSQRHNAAVGQSPWFYEPKYFIPKEKIDAMGARISAARGKPPNSYQSEVPDTALDECEKSYEAADEKKEKKIGRAHV